MLSEMVANIARTHARYNLWCTAIIVVFVSFWVFVLILVPQIAILDISFRPNTLIGVRSISDSGYSLEHYRFFLGGADGHGAARSFIDARILLRTLSAVRTAVQKFATEVAG